MRTRKGQSLHERVGPWTQPHPTASLFSYENQLFPFCYWIELLFLQPRVPRTIQNIQRCMSQALICRIGRVHIGYGAGGDFSYSHWEIVVKWFVEEPVVFWDPRLYDHWGCNFRILVKQKVRIVECVGDLLWPTRNKIHYSPSWHIWEGNKKNCLWGRNVLNVHQLVVMFGSLRTICLADCESWVLSAQG